PLKDWDVKIYRGVLTGFNDAFIIDTETRNRILANCKTEEERKRTEEIIKPVLRGRDIGRYYYKWAGLWVIYIPWHFPLHKNQNITGASELAESEFRKKYPALYSYLLQYKDGLMQRNKEETCKRYEWYALQRWAADYYPEFEKEKIVWQEMTYEPAFAYDDRNYYTNQTIYIMTGKNLKYILGVLNSKVSEKYMSMIAYSLSEGAQRWIKQYVEQIPLPPITPQNHHIVKEIENLVSQILSLTQSPDYETNPQKQAKVKELEKEIDKLVYKLYDLTEEEIKIIGGARNEW
ncbi:TaqI-like C-terminal specificity domain-containing protein, partial [Thermodesulfovibrio sp.]|uniref:TaqI-like C-terminal specificity domain-containing protein n=1 Tax=Thermodesulfovibrio sp. TaxID=2067987 RepID=UPI003D0C669B